MNSKKLEQPVLFGSHELGIRHPEYQEVAINSALGTSWNPASGIQISTLRINQSGIQIKCSSKEVNPASDAPFCTFPLSK